jgi:integrase
LPLAGEALECVKGLAGMRRIDTRLLFPDGSGKKPIIIRAPWHKALKQAGIEDFRFHDLRHSAASYLAMSGASLAEIAEVLGHKTLEMVKRYSHLSEQHTAGVVEKMNKKFLGG